MGVLTGYELLFLLKNIGVSYKGSGTLKHPRLCVRDSQSIFSPVSAA